MADCFAGQPKSAGIQYRIDPGRVATGPQQTLDFAEQPGFKNADLAVSTTALLKNSQPPEIVVDAGTLLVHPDAATIQTKPKP